MVKLHDQWTVLPHGPLREIDYGLLTVVGQIPMPLGNFPRRMTVISLSGNRTALFSPIPLVEQEMKRVELLGQPSFLIIPGGFHRLDAHPFKVRYPEARVVAPPGAKPLVSEAVKVDLTAAHFEDRDVELQTVAGTLDREFALLVRRPGAASLVVNDIIAHVANPTGFRTRLMASLFGFGVGRPAVPRPVRAKLVEDASTLAWQFEKWASIPGLRRIVPSHGEIIDDQPAAQLLRLAKSLKS